MQTKTTLDGVQKSPESEIEEMEITIEQAREYVAMRDDLLKLTKNAAFKRIFMEGYLKKEAVRLTGMLGSAALKDSREDIITDLTGISCFKEYCEMIMRQGDAAEAEIHQYQLALDEAYAEAEE